MIGSRTEEELKADIEHVNRCLNPISLYSTAALVLELATREEVNEYDDDSFQYLIDHYPSGPCTILVVRE